MRNPRSHLVLLTTSLVIVGLVGRAWLPKTKKLAGSGPVTVAASVVTFARALLAAAKASDTPADTLMPAANTPVTETLELSAAGNQLVAEMCDLQLMAQGTDLSLDSSQWSALATVVLRTEAAQHAFEAQMATSSVIAPGRYRVEIPAYADAGEVLREEFAIGLCAELGQPVAMEVMAKLGDRLEGRFAGFGVSLQTLEITAPPGGKSSDVQLTRIVEYWNSVAGSDRVTTRREIHFPTLEDPTGATWGALLAMVEVTGAENGPG